LRGRRHKEAAGALDGVIVEIVEAQGRWGDDKIGRVNWVYDFEVST